MIISSRTISLKSLAGLFIVAVLSVTVAQAQETAAAGIANVNNGGLKSLRGSTELDVDSPAEPFKPVPRDRRPYVSDYVYQPPLIPHSIRGYELSTNANKCLSCHSFKNSVESGATKISVTHYETREGVVLSDVSPRRYFCLQCHVEQTDSDPLIENTFTRVESLQ
ncbi:MAG TPA: nitrate reductase cytochrome c-type subunit [Gammaproteobacteria bacterium]|nr:nitrate reductase cytochrome c-type subunit [Gammaproteobacteria bacterium]